MSLKYYDNRNAEQWKRESKENLKKWSDMLDDNAFGDEVDEPQDLRRVRRNTAINPWGRSSASD